MIEMLDGNVEYDDVTYKGTTYYLPKITNVPLFDRYPIFDSAYRPVLTGMIYDRYMNREIGQETIDEFMRVFRSKMNEIMPYYNELYKSTLIEYDALSTVDIRTVSSNTQDATDTLTGESTEDTTVNGTTASTTEEESHATGSADGEADSSSRAVNSVTPQVMLSGNKDYASSAADSNSNSSNSNDTVNDSEGVSQTDATTSQVSDSTSVTNTDRTSHADSDSDSHTTGYQGVPADLIMRFRDAIINVNTLILNDIEDCFMLVVNSGDAYTRNGWYYW